MKIPKFLEFINESYIKISDELKINLYKIRNILDKESIEWVDKILSNINIDNNDGKENLYLIKYSDRKSYFIVDLFKNMDMFDKRIQEFKIGKAFKLIQPNIPSHILGNIVNALTKIGEYEIKIVSGKEIEQYYNTDKIIYKSTLGNSCMNDKPDLFFNIYTMNESVVELVVLLDYEGFLNARALLWKTKHGTFLDRIYYSSEVFLYKLKEWAKENGHKTSLATDSYIKLENSTFEKYPYLDTFRYLCINKNILASDDIFESKDKVINLTGTEGNDYEIIRNIKYPFQPLYDIYVYRYVTDLDEFINLAIDFETWYKDYTEEQTEVFLLDYIEYLNSYKTNILNNKEIKKIISLNHENFETKLENLKKIYPSKFEEIIKIIIKEINDYDNWLDFHSEINGSSNVIYIEIKDDYIKKYYKDLIDKYCSEDTFNKNFRKLYEQNYEHYQHLFLSFF